VNRGVVLSVDNASMVVFTSGCRLERVPSRAGVAPGQEIIIESTKTSQKSRGTVFRPLMAFAAAIFAIVAGVIISQSILSSRTYAVISVDVNPSIQFSLNEDLIVTDIQALNADAAKLMVKEQYKGLAWQDAVDRWLICLEENGYEDISDVLISAVMPAKDEALKTQLTLLEEGAEDSKYRMHVIYSNDGGVSETARKNGLSVGMQMLLNQSAAQQGPWTAENIKAVPLGEIIRILAQSGEMDQTRITVSHPAGSHTSADPTQPSTPADTRPTADPTKPTKPTAPSNSHQSTEPTETSTEPTETFPTETSAEPTETSAEPTETSAEPTETSAEPTDTSAEPTTSPSTSFSIPSNPHGGK